MKILNFLLRMVYGAIGILVGNFLLGAAGISASVGLNLVSLLTVGSLGFSGLGLLFGISAFGIL
ncbi:MAG: pro-sigmaK processing inhibitor BofA family protein [Lachnospiraceae bacterium]|nr:pro-sigmaK processing inhibitor BofA family protein [Lachnospiraceae bacterium]